MKKTTITDSEAMRKMEKVCTGKDLAKALEHIELTPEEAKAWHKDLVAARKTLKPRGNKRQ